MIHVSNINDGDWRIQGWRSAASATCDEPGCEGWQLVAIFKEEAGAALLKYGELVMEQALERKFGWRKGLCPAHVVQEDVAEQGHDVHRDVEEGKKDRKLRRVK